MLFTVSDDGIFTANCELFVLDKRNAAMQFIIDTGASITCCRAKELGINLKEQDFITNQSEVKYMNGVLKEGNSREGVDRYRIKFYEVNIKKLKIGTSIVLEDISVWVTFDNRFYTCLLGQDILDKLYYLHLRQSGNLFITTEVDELKKYIGSAV